MRLIDSEIILVGLMILGFVANIYGLFNLNEGNIIEAHAAFVVGFNCFIALLICLYMKAAKEESMK